MGKTKKLAANVNVEGTMYGPDYPKNEVTAEVAKKIENPKAWGEGGDEDEEPKGLDDMNAGELKDEIDRRNEGRDDEAKLAKGTKAEMLEALKADDLAAVGA